MDKWHYSLNGQPAGPASADELKTLLAEGKVSDSTLIWKSGMPSWQPLGQVLPGKIPAVPPPAPATPPPVPVPTPPAPPIASAQPSIAFPPQQSAAPAFPSAPPVPPAAAFPAPPPPPPPVVPSPSKKLWGCLIGAISVIFGLIIILGGVAKIYSGFRKASANKPVVTASPTPVQPTSPAQPADDPFAAVAPSAEPARSEDAFFDSLFPAEVNGYKNTMRPHSKTEPGGQPLFSTTYAKVGDSSQNIKFMVSPAIPGREEEQARSGIADLSGVQPKVFGTQQKFFSAKTKDGRTLVTWGQNGVLFVASMSQESAAKEFVTPYYKMMQPGLAVRQPTVLPQEPSAPVPPTGSPSGEIPPAFFPASLGGYQNLTPPYKKSEQDGVPYYTATFQKAGSPPSTVVVMVAGITPGNGDAEAKAAVETAIGKAPTVTGTEQKFFSGKTADGRTILSWGSGSHLFVFSMSSKESFKDFAIPYFNQTTTTGGRASAPGSVAQAANGSASAALQAGAISPSLVPPQVRDFVLVPGSVRLVETDGFKMVKARYAKGSAFAELTLMNLGDAEAAKVAAKAAADTTGKSAGVTPFVSGDEKARFYTVKGTSGLITTWAQGPYAIVANMSSDTLNEQFLRPYFFEIALPSGGTVPSAAAAPATGGGWDGPMPVSVRGFTRLDSTTKERTAGMEYRANFQDDQGQKVMFQVLTQKEAGDGTKLIEKIVANLTKSGWQHVDEDEDRGVTIQMLKNKDAIVVGWASGSGMAAVWGDNKQAIQNFISGLAAQNQGRLVLPGTR